MENILTNYLESGDDYGVRLGILKDEKRHFQLANRYFKHLVCTN